MKTVLFFFKLNDLMEDQKEHRTAVLWVGRIASVHFTFGLGS